MSTTTPYPNGTALVSNALTLAQIESVMQASTLGMIGQTSGADNDAVRIQYPREGAPFQNADEDKCYIRCQTRDNPYDKIRDRLLLPGPDPDVTEQWNYTRTWTVHWCFYGPNSTDNARMVKSALFQDYFTLLLMQSNLYPVSDYPAPVRAPENIDGQWFERSDYEVVMHEFVTETITDKTVLSVEVIGSNDAGTIFDVTVT